jgi:hypothetical protein
MIHVVQIRDGNPEAGSPEERIGANRFHEPQGSASSAKEEAWMFDNEIDWVTQLESQLKRREVGKWRASSECVKKYKAEHMRVGVSCQLRQVFK